MKTSFACWHGGTRPHQASAAATMRLTTTGGVSVPIDPEVLIEDVVLSPRMQPWQVDLFRGLFERLGFRRPVHASSLLTSPF